MITIKTDRLYWIDWLRFLAASAVVYNHIMKDHFVEYFLLNQNSQNIIIKTLFHLSDCGHKAVIMFFSLSGILVGGKLIEKILKGNLIISTYFIDRFFRIYVPYIPILILSGIVSHENFNMKLLLLNILGFQPVYCDIFATNYPLWTLGYEIWFYILAGSAASFFATPLKKMDKLIYFLIFLVSISIYLKFESKYLFCFFIGSCIYFLKLNKKNNTFFLIVSFIFAFGISSASQIANRLAPAYFATSFQFDSFRDIINVFQCGAFCVFIRTASLYKPTKSFIIKIEKLGSTLASFSYTMYLCHVPVLYFLARINLFPSEKFDVVSPYSVYLFILKLIIVIFVSIVLYFAFERNTLYLKNKFKLLFNL